MEIEPLCGVGVVCLDCELDRVFKLFRKQTFGHVRYGDYTEANLGGKTHRNVVAPFVMVTENELTWK